MYKLIVVALVFALTISVEYYHISGDPKTIKGYTGQAVEVESPFTRAFQLHTNWQEDAKYIKFEPNRLELHETARMFLDGKAKSLLESLRTPYADEYRQILVFDEYVLLLKDMNEVVIISDSKTGLNKTTTFVIKEIKSSALVYHAYRYK